MPDDLRDGIIGLNTRQFGRVIELIIGFIYRQRDSKELSFDLKDGETKIEVKGSRVLKSNKLSLTKDNLYELIVSNSNRNRLLRQADCTRYAFDCNIQQIKIAYFDTLYYVLVFYDVLEIFRIEASSIRKDPDLNYSDKQHSGNVGEGQFHINNRNYDHHKSKYFIKSLSYETLKNKLLRQE